MRHSQDVYKRQTLKEAVDKAYELTAKVKFDNGFCRSDIGKRALMGK